MVLQEGTYTVSDTGTPGTYAPGEQIEFIDSMLATGTYCEERNDSNESVYGFITSGTEGDYFYLRLSLISTAPS